MLISLIVAVAENGVIGRDGDLPWHLSDDLKRFKTLTTGKPIIMGRKTFESIGRPLPNRQNIVITRNPHFDADGCTVVSTPQAAIAAAGDAREVMVIGGGVIYQLFIDKAARLYVTRVDAAVDGDTHFPDIDPLVWRLDEEEAVEASERNDFGFKFLTYNRR